MFKTLSVATALAAAMPAISAAQRMPVVTNTPVAITSTTIFTAAEDAAGKQKMPVYEYIDADFRHLAGGTVSMSLSGWYRYETGDQPADGRTDSSLRYAMLNWMPHKDRSLVLTAGRQYVMEGVTADRIDGLYGRWEGESGMSFSLFGGAPVSEGAQGEGSTSMYGSRLAYRFGRAAELGISYVGDSGAPKGLHRSEAGFDIWVQPAASLTLTGLSRYNVETAGFGEHSYTARWSLSRTVDLSLMFSATDYDNLFQSTRSPVFRGPSLAPGESSTRGGGAVDIRFTDALRASIMAAQLSYSLRGSATLAGGSISYQKKNWGIGASACRALGDEPRLSYSSGDAYVMAAAGDASFSLDGHYLHYDRPVQGESLDAFLRASASYAIMPRLSLTLSGEWLKTPDFNDAQTAFVKLTYRYEKQAGEKAR